MNASQHQDGIWRVETSPGVRKIWIHANAENLQARIIVLAHNCPRCYQGADLTEEVSEFSWWPQLRERIRHYVSKCLICWLQRGSELIRRPLDSTTSPQRPGQRLSIEHVDVIEFQHSAGRRYEELSLKTTRSSPRANTHEPHFPGY